MERLAGLLREYPEVEVVVTSSWTDETKLIKGLFPADIALQIIGKTALASSTVEYARCEVLVYLRSVAGAGPWVALDGDPLHNPEHAPVVMVDPEQGVVWNR